jgi:uncharacterized protein (DUF2062 family)
MAKQIASSAQLQNLHVKNDVGLAVTRPPISEWLIFTVLAGNISEWLIFTVLVTLIINYITFSRTYWSLYKLS